MADRQATKDTVRKQVEFYFSDSNYPKDKFLRSQAAQNDGGWVSISIIATFTRMKKISEDVELIKEAVKESTILEVSSDGQNVRRTAPLPETDTSIARTIYAKGFPEAGYTIEDVESVFGKFGKVLSVRIRKMKDGKQKPSAFIEYATPEDATAAAAATSQFAGQDLTVLKKSDYTEKKKQERKEKEGKTKRKAEDSESTNNNNEKKQKKEEKEVKEARISASIIKLESLGKEATRELVKEIFEPFGTVEYVDLRSGDEVGYVRMGSTDLANAAIEALTKENKEIAGGKTKYTLLPADEEKKYWDKVHAAKQAFAKKKRGNMRRKRF